MRALVLLVMLSACGCSGPNPGAFTARKLDWEVNGLPAVELAFRPERAAGHARMRRAVLLPGRALHVAHLDAELPGKGVVPILKATPLNEAAKEDLPFGAAIVAPDAGRGGGLLAGRPLDKIALSDSKTQAAVVGSIDAGDFEGRWPGKLRFDLNATLFETSFQVILTARNSGSDTVSVGIGWRPHFLLPSGRRAEARLRLPANRRAGSVPGDLVAVEGTPLDFGGPWGGLLGVLDLNECFTDLRKDENDHTIIELIDAGRTYGLRLFVRSPQVSAITVRAPSRDNWVAIQPQFNLPDPAAAGWRGSAGMVALAPGRSVSYSVAAHLFQP